MAKKLNLLEPGTVLGLGESYFIQDNKVYTSTGTIDGS